MVILATILLASAASLADPDDASNEFPATTGVRFAESLLEKATDGLGTRARGFPRERH
jgi:hypothetical protein